MSAATTAAAGSANADAQHPLDLLTIGRVSVDLYAEQLNVGVEHVATFRKSIGGTATNVAVAAARLGCHSAVFNRVGDDPMGRYVRHALEHTFAVDTRFVGTDPSYRTPLAFAVMEDPAEPSIDFYREPQAPDMMISVDEIDREVVEQVPIMWFPMSRLSNEPSRSTLTQLLGWRERRSHTIIDLDWRPSFWPDPATATAAVDTVLDSVTMAIGNRTECEIAIGESDPDRAADALLDRGLSAAIVKLGGDGVLVATADGERQRIAPYPVEVVCGLGAGDAFGGALCYGLRAGWDLERCARAGNAAGAIVAARLMCSDDMPYLADIELVLERGHVPAGI